MQGLLIVDHGSRRAESNQQLLAIAHLVQEQLGGDAIVAIAHMEIASPGIAEGISDLLENGVTDITVMPYLLAPGRHVAEDIPRLAQDALQGRTGVTLRVAPCLGVDPMLAALVVKRASSVGFKPQA